MATYERLIRGGWKRRFDYRFALLAISPWDVALATSCERYGFPKTAAMLIDDLFYNEGHCLSGVTLDSNPGGRLVTKQHIIEFLGQLCRSFHGAEECVNRSFADCTSSQRADILYFVRNSGWMCDNGQPKTFLVDYVRSTYHPTNWVCLWKKHYFPCESRDIPECLFHQWFGQEMYVRTSFKEDLLRCHIHSYQTTVRREVGCQGPWKDELLVDLLASYNIVPEVNALGHDTSRVIESVRVDRRAKMSGPNIEPLPTLTAELNVWLLNHTEKKLFSGSQDNEVP